MPSPEYWDWIEFHLIQSSQLNALGKEEVWPFLLYLFNLLAAGKEEKALTLLNSTTSTSSSTSTSTDCSSSSPSTSSSSSSSSSEISNKATLNSSTHSNQLASSKPSSSSSPPLSSSPPASSSSSAFQNQHSPTSTNDLHLGRHRSLSTGPGGSTSTSGSNGSSGSTSSWQAAAYRRQTTPVPRSDGSSSAQNNSNNDNTKNNKGKSNRPSNDDYDDEYRDLCKLCLDAQIETVILDCGHSLLCTKCAAALKQQICPICRQPIKEIKRLYKC